MNRESKIIHVELKEPFLGKKNHYYGSVSAIFQEIPESVIGVKAITVQRNLQKSEVYQASGATIRKGVLTRKSQRR